MILDEPDERRIFIISKGLCTPHQSSSGRPTREVEIKGKERKGKEKEREEREKSVLTPECY